MWDLVWNGKVVFSHESLAKVGWEAMKRNLAKMGCHGDWEYRGGAECRQRLSK